MSESDPTEPTAPALDVHDDEQLEHHASTPVIRGLRAMAIVRWALLFAVATVAGSTWWVYAIRSEATERQPDRYYCAMHPQIRSPVPGKCPICFMELEPIPEERMGGHQHATAPAETKPTHELGPGESPTGLSNVMLTLERRQKMGISISAVTTRHQGIELRLPAVIEAPESAVAEVHVRTPSFIERVAKVETGARVRAGEPLVWVSSQELLQALQEIVATQRVMAESANQGGPTDVQSVTSAARQRLALLGLHPIDINEVLEHGWSERFVPIRAPMNGVITARDVALGVQAMPERSLFQITDLTRVWVNATVSPEQAATLRIGTKGQFVSRSGGRTYEVEAIATEPRLASETRTVTVRFSARTADTSLLPGDIGDVLVQLPATDLVLVPRDSVLDTGTHQYVFVESSAGALSPRIVQTGALVGEERVVLRGIQAGERVVTRGTFVLDSESRLQAALAPVSAEGRASP